MSYNSFNFNKFWSFHLESFFKERRERERERESTRQKMIIISCEKKLNYIF